jgi:hypothetical protein
MRPFAIKGEYFMDATVYTILSRNRNSSASFASPKHFSVDEGQAVRPQIVFEEAAWTPYALDDEQRLIYFVQCPADLDLSQSAFMYSAQFEQAKRLLSLPYEAIESLKTELKKPEKLIFIYSMGRCGSTLMSQILNQVDGVYSLSEPDIFTLICYLRNADASRDAELGQILEFCTLMLYPQQSQRPSTLALKFRSAVIELSDLLQKAFPAAYNLFMYRNALSWAQSVNRFLLRLAYPVTEPFSRKNAIELWTGLTGGDPVYLAPYLGPETESLYFTDLLAPAWTSYLDKYMLNYERGVRFHNLRYEELNEARESSLKGLLDYCGLPASALEETMQAFAKDSQEGTEISRDNKVEDMSEMLISRFLSVLSQHPRFKQADYTLPDKQLHDD